ncbi:MAG: DUF2202 domain-containing protein [Saprospiraceae bacterium]
MKNFIVKPLFLLALLAGASLSIAACEKDNNFTRRNMLQVDETYGYSNINLQDCQYNLDNLPIESLSPGEKTSILFMREEEKLARDIYLKFQEKWNLNAFGNISASEQTHMDAMLKLITKYNLTDPVGANGVGVFTNSDLQALYDALLSQGETSLIEALKVAALVEEVDIVDLQTALATVVDNQDVEMVYENLLAASRNHLRAFVKNLQNQGVTYVPQRLTQAEFDAIINSGWEHGQHGG